MLCSVFVTAQQKSEKAKAIKQKMENLSPEQRAEMRLKRLTKELNLDQNQQNQVKEVIAEGQKKQAAAKTARENRIEKLSKEERTAFKAKLQEEEKALAQKMKAILNPEQFTKWEALKEKQKKRMQENKNRRSNPEVLEEITE